MTPEEILERAMEVLERDGWYQGGLVERQWHGDATEVESAHSPVCAIGSIWRAATGHAVNDYACKWVVESQRDNVYAAVRLLAAVTATKDVQIAEWNDSPLTSKEDVLLGMKEAIHHGRG